MCIRDSLRGAILDGFPRTEEQAQRLDKLVGEDGGKIDKVFSLQVNEDSLVERIDGRRVHLPSGRSYHVKFNPPKEEGKDDVTGEPLIKRPDDDEKILRKRLTEYKKKTEPVLSYYEKRGNLKVVDANQPIDEVWNQIFNTFNKAVQRKKEGKESTIKCRIASGFFIFKQQKKHVSRKHFVAHLMMLTAEEGQALVCMLF
eukprot:TRINITY_DN568_c0_g1_i2.p1 TRINITY_DN568_c0_g1~~TRINITY_DN568_c0_g1_i2.p1  ORF type:complete len:228 (-),score=60.00 TRINITY_DN568_c0_g1_i2:214-813(-)